MPEISKIPQTPKIPRSLPNGDGDSKKVSTFLDSLPSAWDMLDSVKMLLYGGPGVGKTVFAAGFPGPIVALICSSNAQPGELKSIRTPEYMAKINPRIISNTEQLHQVTDYLMSGKYGTIGTLVLDHASGLQDMLLAEVLEQPISDHNREWGAALKEDWGAVTQRAKDLMKPLISLPCHVVIVAHERTFKEDESRDSEVMSPVVGPALTPSLAGWFHREVDYICQMFKRQKQRVETVTEGEGESKVTFQNVIKLKGEDYCLRLRSGGTYYSKVRMPVSQSVKLPEYIVNPSFAKLKKLIDGDATPGR